MLPTVIKGLKIQFAVNVSKEKNKKGRPLGLYQPSEGLGSVETWELRVVLAWI